jgi:NAD(P)-dependent dehydrogenase (short-subunit alcohol dehydrogenase family)
MSHDVSTFGLEGRVCVVTGAASGIGRGVAIALAKVGGRVVILDRNVEGAQETLSQISVEGGGGLVIACDVSDPASVQAAGEKSFRDLGPCAVLVNNAGMIRAGSLEALSFEDWNELLSVNLTGYFLCSQVFGRQMRSEGKGALVHIASIASNHVTAFSGAYSIAKAGVTMLSRQLAVEWGPHGIRSNAVNPGMILTPLSEAMYQQPGVMERRSKVVPVGRIGHPEDIAEAVLFLASDRASYINGDEVTVDGGFTQMLLSMIPRVGFERPVT